MKKIYTKETPAETVEAVNGAIRGALKDGRGRLGDIVYGSALGLIFGPWRALTRQEKGQITAAGEQNWKLCCALQSLPRAAHLFTRNGLIDVKCALEDAIEVTQGRLPYGASYRDHPAFELAQQWAAIKGDEARIMAKHYFRVAFRGLSAGGQP